MIAAPSNRRRTRLVEGLLFWAFRIGTYFVLLCATYIFLDIGIKGSRTVFTRTAPFVNLTFLSEPPQTLYVFDYQGKKMELSDRQFRDWKTTHKEEVDVTSVSYSAGGIWPCIVGTALLVIGSMTLALFIGISCAIYLSEYSRDGRFIRLIRVAILNLAGVPSIVFGLFGFGLFVIFFGWNVSLLALGATKWQTIRKNVLPYALPGILTSSILGIARVAGETAPIMFTAAYAMRDEMPWQVSHWTNFFFQGVMALPYHIYVVSSKIPQNEYTERVQYGTAFVFLVVVMLIALTSILLREKQRRRLSW